MLYSNNRSELWSQASCCIPGKLGFKRKIFPYLFNYSLVMHRRHMRIPCSIILTSSFAIKFSVQHKLSVIYTFIGFSLSESLQSGGSQWAKVNGPWSGRSLVKADGHLGQSRRSWVVFKLENLALKSIPLVITSAFINVISRNWLNIIAIMSVPKTFKLVTFFVIVTVSICILSLWAIAVPSILLKESVNGHVPISGPVVNRLLCRFWPVHSWLFSTSICSTMFFAFLGI